MNDKELVEKLMKEILALTGQEQIEFLNRLLTMKK